MDNIQFGALVAQRRKERNLTQKDLAQALHVSPQAVSKWERGLNFPDLALLEPLAGLLDVTVSELMAGERGAPPQEAAVRELLRMGLAQMRAKVRKWRRLFGAALALLLALALTGGYLYVRDNTELLPQRTTVIAPRDSTELAQLAARTTGGSSVYFYDLTMADGLEEMSARLELWTREGLVRTWYMAKWGGGLDGLPRHQILAFTFDTDAEMTALEYGFTTSRAAIWNGALKDVPYLSGGYGLSTLQEPVTVSPERGAVLACFFLDTSGEGRWRFKAWTGDMEAPEVGEGGACLLLRVYFQ